MKWRGKFFSSESGVAQFTVTLGSLIRGGGVILPDGFLDPLSGLTTISNCKGHRARDVAFAACALKGDLDPEDALEVKPKTCLVRKPIVTHYLLGATIPLEPPPYESIATIL